MAKKFKKPAVFKKGQQVWVAARIVEAFPEADVYRLWTGVGGVSAASGYGMRQRRRRSGCDA